MNGFAFHVLSVLVSVENYWFDHSLLFLLLVGVNEAEENKWWFCASCDLTGSSESDKEYQTRS